MQGAAAAALNKADPELTPIFSKIYPPGWDNQEDLVFFFPKIADLAELLGPLGHHCWTMSQSNVTAAFPP